MADKGSICVGPAWKVFCRALETGYWLVLTIPERGLRPLRVWSLTGNKTGVLVDVRGNVFEFGIEAPGTRTSQLRLYYPAAKPPGLPARGRITAHVALTRYQLNDHMPGLFIPVAILQDGRSRLIFVAPTAAFRWHAVDEPQAFVDWKGTYQRVTVRATPGTAVSLDFEGAIRAK